MAVYKSKDKHRDLPWCADWYEGAKRRKRYFPTRGEAENCEEAHKASLRNKGLPLTIEALKHETVADIVKHYLVEQTPKKLGKVSEACRLEAFLKRDICKVSLAHIDEQDGYRYVDDRQKETYTRGKTTKPITPRTLRRELNLFQHIFETARRRWGYKNLTNPFRDIEIRGSKKQRQRRLEEGELERLTAACERCRGQNRYYVPLAIYCAVETGMRLQEIFNLTWGDVDFKNRRIVIRKSKTDHLTDQEGRTIVLPFMTQVSLMALAIGLRDAGLLPTLEGLAGPQFTLDELIFPMGKDAFKQAYYEVVKRAKLAKHLTFHDLRHEAATRFYKILEEEERALMLGHNPKTVAAGYIHVSLGDIQDKLDRATLNGKTLAEVRKEAQGVYHKDYSEEMKRAANFVGLRDHLLAPMPLAPMPEDTANVVQFSNAKAS